MLIFHSKKPTKCLKKENKKTAGVNWGTVAHPGRLPQHVSGCMPGVVEEPSPSRVLKLTSSFFAATLIAWAWGGLLHQRVWDGPGGLGGGFGQGYTAAPALMGMISGNW